MKERDSKQKFKATFSCNWAFSIRSCSRIHCCSSLLKRISLHGVHNSPFSISFMARFSNLNLSFSSRRALPSIRSFCAWTYPIKMNFYNRCQKSNQYIKNTYSLRTRISKKLEHLHYSPLILKPKLDLGRCKSKFPSQLTSLPFVWVLAFLKISSPQQGEKN